MRHPFGDTANATVLLGSEHPLTTALRDIVATARQLIAAAAIAIAGLLTSTAGGRFGMAVALGAAGVAIVLGVRLSLAQNRAREHARDTIIAGDQQVPISLLRRERNRLLKPSARALLACTYDDLARRAEPGGTAPPSHATSERTALAHDLRGVALLLRDPGLDAAGVALGERLLEDRDSPLYGADIDALRSALGRIARVGPDRRTSAR